MLTVTVKTEWGTYQLVSGVALVRSTCQDGHSGGQFFPKLPPGCYLVVAKDHLHSVTLVLYDTSVGVVVPDTSLESR